MGGLSIWHWLIVLLVVVLIFGTKKLRNIGQDLGGAVKGFKEGMKSPEGSEPAPPSATSSQTDRRADDRRRSEEREDAVSCVFDIAFSEIAVIAVVALVVIGPERLPKVARTLGHMFGRLQRYVNDVKADINREIELDELRKLKARCNRRRRKSSARSRRRRPRSKAVCVRSKRSSTRRRRKPRRPPRLPAPIAPASDEAAPAVPHSTAADAPRQPSLPGFDRI